MQRTPWRRALALSAVVTLVSVGGACAARLGHRQRPSRRSRPAEEIHRTPPSDLESPTSEPTPKGAAALPDQASYRARSCRANGSSVPAWRLRVSLRGNAVTGPGR
jgi:hypothetical protein